MTAPPFAPLSSPRGAPRDSKSAFKRVCDALCVAGTPLRGPITTVFGYGSRLSARFAGVGRDDDPFRRSFIRTKNQPSRVVGSPPLFPACYLQGKSQLERVSRQRAATGIERVMAHAGCTIAAPISVCSA